MTNFIIPFLPDWISFLLIAGVLLVIYFYMPEGMQSGIKKFMISYGIYVIIILFAIYFHHFSIYISEAPDKFPANIKRSDFFFGLGLFIYFAFSTYLYQLRYNTNHAIADNRSGSCHRFVEVGDWLVLFIGTTGSAENRAVIITWPWCQEIWVVPKCALQFVGNQMFIRSKIDKVDIIDVDEDVAHFISNDTFGKWAKEDIYSGLWDVPIAAKNPDYKSLELELNKKNDRINELKEMLKGKLSTVKGFVSDTIAMQDKLRGKTWGRSKPADSPREE